MLPQLNEQINCDVLIIGGDFSGLLSAYIFHDKKIKVAIIEKNKIDESSLMHYEIDEDIKNLMAHLNEYQKIDAFRFTLESIYKLENVFSFSNETFTREPNCVYGDKRYNKGYGLPFFKGQLYYNSGFLVEPKSITQALLNYCEKENVPIYENTGVYEYDIQNDKVIITTQNKKQITCKKVLISSDEDCSLFLDDSYETSCQINAQNIHYQLIDNNPEKLYQFCDINLQVKEHPYIETHSSYPNIYFNIRRGKKGLLYALMGAMVLSDKYLGFNDHRLLMLKSLR